MKKIAVILVVTLTLFCICSERYALAAQNELKAVEHIGQVPDAFKTIVEQNAFHDAVAFDGRIMKTEILSYDEDGNTIELLVHMMDQFGKDMAAYPLTTSRAYPVRTLTTTDDGGFLFVLGFQDYAVDQNVWASDGGFASRIIKCDKNGEIQFETFFESTEGEALKYCFEKNELFYIFGTKQTPETKRRGVYSKTDVYSAIVDQTGQIIKTRCIAGSDYDNLKSAETTKDYFSLSVRSQSDDGDFAGSESKGYGVNWVFTLDDDLAIVKKEIGSGRSFFDDKLGVLNGITVYRSDPMFIAFDAGYPTAVIDYGGFYLIVSENNTGEYEKTPALVSSSWYYTETVYSAYDKEDGLLFRTSVDTSPDYDAIVENFYR